MTRNCGQRRAALRCILQGEVDSIHAGMVWSSVFYIMAHLQSEIRHWIHTCVTKLYGKNSQASSTKASRTHTVLRVAIYCC